MLVALMLGHLSAEGTTPNFSMAVAMFIALLSMLAMVDTGLVLCLCMQILSCVLMRRKTVFSTCRIFQ